MKKHLEDYQIGGGITQGVVIPMRLLKEVREGRGNVEVHITDEAGKHFLLTISYKK